MLHVWYFFTCISITYPWKSFQKFLPNYYVNIFWKNCSNLLTYRLSMSSLLVGVATWMFRVPLSIWPMLQKLVLICQHLDTFKSSNLCYIFLLYLAPCQRNVTSQNSRDLVVPPFSCSHWKEFLGDFCKSHKFQKIVNQSLSLRTFTIYIEFYILQDNLHTDKCLPLS